jgi:hypothetical protein
VLDDVEMVLSRYESGQMSRRQVLAALVAMMIPLGDRDPA